MKLNEFFKIYVDLCFVLNSISREEFDPMNHFLNWIEKLSIFYHNNWITFWMFFWSVFCIPCFVFLVFLPVHKMWRSLLMWDLPQLCEARGEEGEGGGALAGGATWRGRRKPFTGKSTWWKRENTFTFTWLLFKPSLV